MGILAMVQVPYSNISGMKWIPYPAGLSQVWVDTSNEELTRFIGFKSADKERLSEQLQKFGVTLDESTPSVKGANWGTYEFQGKLENVLSISK